MEQSLITETVGIRLNGLDMANQDHVETLRARAHQHACVLLKDQELSPGDLMKLARQLGVPLPPYRPQYSADGYPEVVRIGNVPDTTGTPAYLNRGGIEWHTDSPGSSHPPGYSLLYCLESEIPDGGGETGFASTVSGLRALPDEFRKKIEDFTLVHSFNTFNDQVAGYEKSDVPAQSGDLRERNQDTFDPIIQAHPATGDQHLYVSHAMVKDIPGCERETGMQLIMQAVELMTADDLIYKHQWRAGDLIVFDNRTCLHTPFPYTYDDFPRTRRLLHQIIIGGRR